MKLKGESLQGEKDFLQSEFGVFIDQVAGVRVELGGRQKSIEEELRLVDEVKIKEDSNVTKMKLASATT